MTISSLNLSDMTLQVLHDRLLSIIFLLFKGSNKFSNGLTDKLLRTEIWHHCSWYFEKPLIDGIELIDSCPSPLWDKMVPELFHLVNFWVCWGTFQIKNLFSILGEQLQTERWVIDPLSHFSVKKVVPILVCYVKFPSWMKTFSVRKCSRYITIKQHDRDMIDRHTSFSSVGKIVHFINFRMFWESFKIKSFLDVS